MSEHGARDFRHQIERLNDFLAEEIGFLDVVLRSPRTMIEHAEVAARRSALVGVKVRLWRALSSGSEPEGDDSSQKSTTTKI